MFGTTQNSEATYTMQGGNLTNHGIKSCTDGGFNDGWYLGSSNGMAANDWEVDVFCEMTAAMGAVSQYSGGGAQAWGSYSHDNLFVGGSGEFCGDFSTDDSDCCMRMKNPWFFCAVEACCDEVYRASSGANYCLWYGPDNNDWGADNSWYRGYSAFYGQDSSGQNHWNPWIPSNFSDRITDSHCDFGAALTIDGNTCN